MFSLDDTIAAISTPMGEGGVGIVRMSGPESPSILAALFRPGSGRAGALGPLALVPRHLHFGHILEPSTGERVDEVLAVHMPAPGTYTRQDVVEINGHGGIVALRRILSLCLCCGARLAEPGEFTARAFLNGRLDLAQAEAVLDIVRAKTDRSLQAAVGQLEGHLSGKVRVLRDVLVGALAYLEASLDFPEDEIPERDLDADLESAALGLGRLLADADRGIVFRQGVRAAIVGRPNVGKSSLLNRLLRTNRAIVTDIPGTTRDTLEETLNLQGVPVVLVDTAGIASPRDPLEAMGMERSRSALAQADLALLVVDASQPLEEADHAMADLVGPRPAIVVLNKVDLVPASPSGQPAGHDHSRLLDAPAVAVSALTGEGMEQLEHAVVDAVFSGRAAASAPVVTNPRHKEALGRALDRVEAARVARRAEAAADLVAIDLAAALRALGEITGQTAGEDVISAIFSRFCVGK